MHSVGGGAGAGDRKHLAGLVTAEEGCAGCHGITRGAEYSPTLGAPTFGQIALTPGMTAMALSATLKTSHRTMPNLMLGSDELANIAAYIMSLKGDQSRYCCAATQLARRRDEEFPVGSEQAAE